MTAPTATDARKWVEKDGAVYVQLPAAIHGGGIVPRTVGYLIRTPAGWEVRLCHGIARGTVRTTRSRSDARRVLGEVTAQWRAGL